MYQALSKSALNSYSFSSYNSFNGGIGEEIVTAGMNPKISAENNKVIKAVLINIEKNKLSMIPFVSNDTVKYLAKFPSFLKSTFKRKFTIITTNPNVTVNTIKYTNLI